MNSDTQYIGPHISKLSANKLCIFYNFPNLTLLCNYLVYTAWTQHYCASVNLHGHALPG